ncbi:MAG: geranylgeranyl reductase family protein [Acidimicrobiia bacterium]|nr:geranylgeranyl reductase family protein [Acidimicrobiia bacterium]
MTSRVDETTSRRADVLVVGAGPSGVAAAITAQRAGLRVIVIDKATFPRDKCCGDGLTTGALRLLDRLGLAPSSVPSWTPCRDVTLRSPSGRTIELQLPDDGQFAAIATREDLDDALVRHARSLGIEVREATEFVGATSAAGGTAGNATGNTVRVETSAGTIEARTVIAADGMWSPVRKAVAPEASAYLGEWHAARQYAHNVTGPAAHRLFVWFEPELLPGYAWSFPLQGGRANLGYGILRGGSVRTADSKALWQQILTRSHVQEALGTDAVIEEKFMAWPIPAKVTSSSLSHGHVLFVGDAARATDVLTGEGIGQALLSGILAGEAAATKHPARSYERAMKNNFFADHRMSALLGRVLASERLARGAMRIIDGGDWRKEKFVRWMFEDEARASAFTPRRWHRGYLSSRGAYAN